MGSHSVLKLACLVVVCLAVVVSGSAPMAEAITCGQVTTNLAPCLNYLRRGGFPSPPCCGGVRTTVNSARTTRDRQALCNCLKGAARASGAQSRFAQALPSYCRVFIPYKISMSTNCASIRF